MIRPLLRNIGTYDHPNLRAFQPEDPTDVALHLSIEVGRKGTRGTDEFTVLVATPRGLAALPPSPLGILRAGKVVVIERYDFDRLWAWVETTVDSCCADTWSQCGERLHAYFNWEFAEAQRHR